MHTRAGIGSRRRRRYRSRGALGTGTSKESLLLRWWMVDGGRVASMNHTAWAPAMGVTVLVLLLVASSLLVRVPVSTST